LKEKDGYGGDTDIEICLVYCLTSLILQELLLFQLHPLPLETIFYGPKHNNIVIFAQREYNPSVINVSEILLEVYRKSVCSIR